LRGNFDGHLARDRLVNTRHFALGIGHHRGLAVVGLQTNLHVQRQSTQVVHLITLGHFLATIGAENVLNMTTICADMNGHVFNNAQNRHPDLFKHLDALLGIEQSDVLRRGHNDSTCHGHTLAQCQLNVTSAGWHVDDQIIQVFPVGLA